MSKLALRTTRLAVYQWFIAQICVVAVVSLMSFFFRGPSSILATFLGGLICAVPQALLARWVFAYYRANASKRIVQKFYLGELFKLLFTGLLFVAALLKWPNHAPELLLGFFSAQLGFWFAPYLVKLRVK